MAERETGFAAWLATLGQAPGPGAVVLREPGVLGIATVAAARGREKAARGRLADLVGASLLPGSVCATAGAITVVATGPGTWLVMRDGASADWLDGLATSLDGVAAAFDQSSGYAVLHVVGGGAARLLQKGVNVDLHPDAFPPGTAAVTLAAHVGLVLWRPGAATFGVAVFRSLAGSFAHWLDGAAAMTGMTLYRSDRPETV